MERDKELLLPVEASDSEDAVEEFKLPPPRTRRPKARCVCKYYILHLFTALLFMFIICSLYTSLLYIDYIILRDGITL